MLCFSVLTHIAVSLFLSGIITLVSRTANSFQGPFMAKRVELDIAYPVPMSA
ncbi:lipid II flippase family protein [Paraburkholderia xenovorans]|uniref:lipid II flippase family protein n=1 Tax=Paraburkholderia xenovorans TaxID=36873 RepID=UPI000B339B90